MMNCLYCGKELPRQHKKYCSRGCYSKSGGPTKQTKMELIKQCLVCGKKFLGEGDKYCSRECYHKSPTKGRPPIKPKKSCLVCGQLIEGRGQKFCSIACSAKFNIGKSRPNAWKRYINICRQCGKEFKVGGRKGRHKNTVFCSRECQARSQRKDTGYRAWSRLAKSVIDRDGHCVLCGNSARRLQVHHVIPRDYRKWSEFKGTETAKDLITVCPGCHQSIECLTKAGFRNNPNFNPFDLIKMVRSPK